MEKVDQTGDHSVGHHKGERWDSELGRMSYLSAAPESTRSCKVSGCAGAQPLTHHEILTPHLSVPVGEPCLSLVWLIPFLGIPRA